MDKGDVYKYYFHTNIIIHEYMKLNYFLDGKTEYSYLPKQGMDYIGRRRLLKNLSICHVMDQPNI